MRLEDRIVLEAAGAPDGGTNSSGSDHAPVHSGLDHAPAPNDATAPADAAANAGTDPTDSADPIGQLAASVQFAKRP